MGTSWFVFSILATLSFGIGMALYKVPSFKKQSRYVTAFWAMIIPLVLSIIFFNSFLYLSSWEMVLAAGIWGIAFSLLVMFQMYALKYVDTNALFPITSTISLVVTLVVGFLIFNELISLVQFLGILIVLVIVYVYLYKKDKLQYSNTILFTGLGIIAFSAFNKLLHKFVATSFDIHAYQIYQYLFAAIFSFLILAWVHRKNIKKAFSKKSFFAGGLIGIFSFLGGYSWLIALTKGSFVLVTSIHSLYILITALTGFFLFKEKLNKKIILLIIGAILALLLMKLG